MSFSLLLSGPLTSWLWRSLNSEEVAGVSFPTISVCHGHDHQDSWYGRVQSGVVLVPQLLWALALEAG